MTTLSLFGRTRLGLTALGGLLMVAAACGSDGDGGPSGNGGGEGGEAGSAEEGGSSSDAGSPNTGKGGTPSTSGGEGGGPTAGETGDAGSAGETSAGGSGGEAGQPTTPDGGEPTGEAGSGGAGGAAEAGAGGEAGSGGPGPGGIQANADAIGDLVGFPVTLSAEDSEGTDLSFQWTILSVPDGSEITSADIDDDTAESTTFMPDKGGVYEIGLEVTGDEGSDEATVDATALVVGIPFVQVTSTAAEMLGVPTMIDSDGENLHGIGCEFELTAADEDTLFEFIDSDLTTSIAPFYPGVGATPLLAYPSGVTVDSGGAPTPAEQLNVATGDTECGDTIDLPAGITPAFSPDGSRLAYSSATEVVTVGSDGTASRVLRTAETAHAFWLDDTTVAWPEESVTDGVADLWAATDSDTPAAELIMSCTDAVGHFGWLRQFAMTSQGIAALVDPADTATIDSVYLLTPDGDGDYSCDSADPLNDALYTNDDPDNQDIIEMAVSPSGNSIVFVKQLGTGYTGPTELWSVQAAGGTATKLIDPIAGRNTGVHFVASGRQIVWTSTTYESSEGYDRPQLTQIWRANADGSEPTMILEVESTETDAIQVTTGTNWSCNVSFGGVAGGGLGAGASLLGLMLLARRRARRVRPV